MNILTGKHASWIPGIVFFVVAVFASPAIAGLTETTTTVDAQTTTESAAAQNVTLTATVTRTQGGPDVESGQVTFQVKDGMGNNVGSEVTDTSIVAGAAEVSYELPAVTLPGTYTIEASFTDGGISFVDSMGTADLTVEEENGSDISITKTDGVTSVVPGGEVTYTIVVTNLGPEATTVDGVTVVDSFPPELETCTWTSEAAGGASGNEPGPTVGNINDDIFLPVGSSVTYTAVCTVAFGVSGTLSNTATAMATEGTTDPNLENNSATDNDTIVCQDITYVDEAGDYTITNDVDPSGLSEGDTVTWNSTNLGTQAGLIFGSDAYTNVQFAVNAVCDGGTVKIAAGTYFGTPINIARSVTLQGDGQTIATIDGDNEGRVVEITPGAFDVTIDGLTIQNGNAFSQFGGGILNNSTGTVTVSNSTVSSNAASDGGGIANDSTGTLNITKSTVAGNTANDSGGFFSPASEEFDGISHGGGVLNQPGGTVVITGSTISGNDTSSFSGRGGGIHNEGNITIVNSTISGNGSGQSGETDDGGGLSNDGESATAILINSTVSGNTAENGEISSGGGIYSGNGGALTLRNTIVAGNSAPSGPDIASSSAITSNGGNFVGDDSGFSGLITGDKTFNSEDIGIDDLLDTTLANNGGPTLTHALVAGSPVIDMAVNADALDAGSNPLTTDQRGAGFSRIINTDVDMGAFEFNSLTFSKTFESFENESRLVPDIIGPGSTTRLVFTITNDTEAAIGDVAFTDVLPPGVTIAPVAELTSDCDGILTAPEGGNTISLTGGRVGANSSCTISVNVTSSVIGAHVNTSGPLTSDKGGAGPATATLTVDGTRVGLYKSFLPSTINFGQKSRLTFTIDNSANPSAVTSSLSFIDQLPPGLEVASPANIVHNCPTLFFAPAPGDTLLSAVLPGFPEFPAMTSCTISLDVIATTPGDKDNVSGQMERVVTPSPPSVIEVSGFAAARLEVLQTVFFKVFTDDPVPPGGTATLQFTINNFDRDVGVTGLTFTDVLTDMFPGAAAVGLPLNDVCGTGSVLSGTSTITLTGGNLGPGESCTFNVPVLVPTGVAAGSYTNTTSALNSDSGQFAGPASDDLVVSIDPILTKEFIDDPVGSGGSVTLRFTITNPSSSSISDIAFTDDLNTAILGLAANGLVDDEEAAPVFDVCGDGSMLTVLDPDDIVIGETVIVIPADPTMLEFSGGSLAAGESCFFDVVLDLPDGVPSGTYLNTTSEVTALDESEIPITGLPASGPLEVVGGLRLLKEFTDDPVDPGGPVTLQFTLTHSVGAPAPATGISFTDDLGFLSGLVQAAGQLPLSNICGPGSALIDNDGVLEFSGGTLAPGESCVFSVVLTAPASATAGSYANTTSSVTATVDGQATTSLAATDNLKIRGISFTKEFIGDPVLPGGSVTLRFTLENVHPTADATGIGFSDNLGNVLPGTPDILVTTGLPVSGCGGSLDGTPAGASTFLSFSGGSLTAGSPPCTLEVTVDVPAGAAADTYLNTTSSVSSSLGTDEPATDTLIIVDELTPPPLFSKNFDPESVGVGEVSTLTFLIDNENNDFAVTDLSFSDTLPNTLLIANPSNGIVNGCSGGILTANSGTDTISYGPVTTGDASLAAGFNCTISVDVVGSVTGSYQNTSGDLTSSAGNSGPASAILTVEALDYGDAPGPQEISGGYPTLLADDGARHAGGGTLRLGVLWDAEADGQSSANADGDDTLDTDDEDGATFSSLVLGEPAGIDVSASDRGLLSLWLDLNIDGDWDDTGEQLISDQSILAGASTVPFTVPGTAKSGATFARLRFSNQPGLTPRGIAVDGEVEDYAVTVSGASIHGRKFNDLDQNGERDAGEEFLNGWTIELLDSEGTVIATQVTMDVDLNGDQSIDPETERGWYWFRDLIAGNYSVREVLQQDWIQTAPPSGVFTLTIAGGETVTDIDFGNALATGSIGDFVWHDLDGDGVQDPGEPGLPGVVVYVDANNNGALDAGDSFETTGSLGEYDFTNLGAGLYVIRVEPGPEIAGLQLTTGNIPLAVDLATEEDFDDADFGFRAPAGDDILLTKLFTDDPVLPGGTVTLEFTITNGLFRPLTDISFSDDLNAVLAGLVPAAGQLPIDDLCGEGSQLADDGSGGIILTGGQLDDSESCTFSLTLEVPASAELGDYENRTSVITGKEGDGEIVVDREGPRATDTLTVSGPLLLEKTFTDDPVSAGGTATLKFKLTNLSTDQTISNIAFDDDLAALVPGLPGLLVSTSLPLADICGDGSQLELLSGTDVLSFTGGTLAPGEMCMFSVVIEIPQDANPGNYLNTTSAPTGLLGNEQPVQGLSASDTLTIQGIVFTKAFTDDPVAPGGTATLEFTLANLTNQEATNIAFSDDLEAVLAGLRVNGLPSPGFCGPGSQLTGTGGDAEGFAGISLTGGSLDPGQSCTFSVIVSVPASADLGSYTNTTSTLALNLDGDPTTGPAASDDLEVAGLPLLVKDFTDDPAVPGGIVTLKFTLTNTSGSPMSGLGFTDNLDDVLPGLAASVLPDGGFCGPSSTISGTSTIIASGMSLAAGESCEFLVTLDVPAGADQGDYLNVTSIVSGFISGEIPVEGAPAADILTVVQAPLLQKEFLDDPVPAGSVVTLEFTLTNTNENSTASNVSFSDNVGAVLPGLTILPEFPLNDVCGAGSQLIENDGVITLTNGLLAPSETCTFSVELLVPTVAASGSYPNTTSIVSAEIDGSTVSGPAATDDLDITDLLFSKSFTDDPVVPGGTVTLEFSLTNTGTETLSDLEFTDDLKEMLLPGIMALDLPKFDICGDGSLLDGFDGVLFFIGGSLDPGETCTFTVLLQVPETATPGEYLNTTSPVSTVLAQESLEEVAGPAEDTLIVQGPLTLSKSFIDDPAFLGGTTTLEFTLINSSALPITGITFTDDLSAVLPDLVAVGLPQNDICGTGSSISGTSLLTFTGGSLDPGQSCTFTVTLQIPERAEIGTYLNTTSEVTATMGLNGESTLVTAPGASDDLVIEGLSFQGPTLEKAFIGDPVLPGGTVTLKFTLSLVEALDPAVAIGFSDDLNAVLPGLTAIGLPLDDVCGPFSQLSEDSGVLTLTGGILNPGEVCMFEVELQVPETAPAGTYLNTTSNVESIVGQVAVSGPPASDELVVSELSFTKSFSNDPVAPGDTVILEFTLSNASATEAVTGISFTDDLGAFLPGLVATDTPQNDVCGLGSQLTGTSVLTFSGGSLDPSASCTFSVTLQVPADAETGDYENNTSGLSATQGETPVTLPPAADNLLVLNALSITKSFTDDPVVAGGQVTLEFVLSNTSLSQAATDIAFTDDLTAVIPGLEATGLPQSDICGAGSEISGTSVLSFTGGSLAPGGSCTFSVTLQVPLTAIEGSYVNTVDDLTGEVGGETVPGDSASDALFIRRENQPPELILPPLFTAPKQTPTGLLGIIITDPDSTELTVTMTVTRGGITIAEDVPGGVEPGEVTHFGLSVEIVSSPAKIAATLADPNGVVYTGFLNIVGTDTLDVTVDDGVAPVVSGSATINVTGSTYDFWRNDEFAFFDLIDPADEDSVWGDDTSPEDIFANIFEFLHGLDPEAPEFEPQVTLGTTTVGPDAFVTYSFRKRKDIGGTTLTVEVSGDRNGPFTALAGPSNTVDLGGDFEQVTYTDNVPVTSTAPRFGKLVIVPSGP